MYTSSGDVLLTSHVKYPYFELVQVIFFRKKSNVATYFDHGRLPITLGFLSQSLKTEPLGISLYNLVLNEENKLVFKSNKVV